MKNLHDEIEKELTTFKGQTFSNSEDVNKWIHDAMFRIAEKTVEAVRVEKKNATWFMDNYFTAENAYPTFKKPNEDKSDLGDLWVAVTAKEVHNQAVTEQTNLASKWLGKE